MLVCSIHSLLLIYFENTGDPIFFKEAIKYEVPWTTKVSMLVSESNGRPNIPHEASSKAFVKDTIGHIQEQDLKMQMQQMHELSFYYMCFLKQQRQMRPMAPVPSFEMWRRSQVDPRIRR